MGLVSASPLAHPQPYRYTEPAAPPRSSAPSGPMEPAAASPRARPPPCRYIEPVEPPQSFGLSGSKGPASAAQQPSEPLDRRHLPLLNHRYINNPVDVLHLRH